MKLRSLIFGAAGLAAVIATSQHGEAHKPITSKYTYNDDVFPILKSRCARCHVQGGVGPMSLMTYEEAFPWAESIRAELVAGHMPPATAEEGFGEVLHAQALPPREMDVLLTWASGGNPRGSLDQRLPVVELVNDWPGGKPDATMAMPAEYTLAADKMEDTYEFTVATGLDAARWIRAVDLRPGTPSIVRSALITVKDAPDQILARWLPGQDAPPKLANAAFQLPARADLVVRVRYKKTWSYEGKALSDRSTIGIYFADAAAATALTPVTVASQGVPSTKGQTFTFSRTLDQDVRAVAISPDQVPDNLTLQVEAVRPDGTRTPMIRFAARPEWTRRYWFAEPLTLPHGTRVEVQGTVTDPDLVAAAFGGPVSPEKSAAGSKLSLALDVVPAAAKPSAP
jgi:hypothetical protein